VSGQAIGVEFESVGYKKFMIDVCLKQGFLCHIEE
jgi:DNA helicase II / ATP-dependent DNA helicase PcrA